MIPLLLCFHIEFGVEFEKVGEDKFAHILFIEDRVAIHNKVTDFGSKFLNILLP